jgi:glyoxylase-like metal-dependent hydrolase (beta-lactamase superfamily II)
MTVRSITILRDGHFEIDKGLMVYLKTSYFGQKYMAPVRPLLVRTADRNILLDTGVGDVPEKLRAYYPVQRDSNLKESLAAEGLRPEDISMVINTHLHFDHAGNNRMFPRAAIYAQKAELDFARNPPRFLRGGYIRDHFETPNLHTIEGPQKLADGVRVLPTPGHTAGHQSVVIDMQGKRYVYTGDVSPVRENWETGIPVGILLDPMAAVQSLELCKALGALPIFSHDDEQWEL